MDADQGSFDFDREERLLPTRWRSLTDVFVPMFESGPGHSANSESLASGELLKDFVTRRDSARGYWLKAAIIDALLVAVLLAAALGVALDLKILDVALKSIAEIKEVVLIVQSFTAAVGATISLYVHQLDLVIAATIDRIYREPKRKLYKLLYLDMANFGSFASEKHEGLFISGIAVSLLAVFGFGFLIILFGSGVAYFLALVHIFLNVYSQPSAPPLVNKLALAMSFASIVFTLSCMALALKVPYTDLTVSRELKKIKEKAPERYLNIMKRFAAKEREIEERWCRVFAVAIYFTILAFMVVTDASYGILLYMNFFFSFMVFMSLSWAITGGIAFLAGRKIVEKGLGTNDIDSYLRHKTWAKIFRLAVLLSFGYVFVRLTLKASF